MRVIFGGRKDVGEELYKVFPVIVEKSYRSFPLARPALPLPSEICKHSLISPQELGVQEQVFPRQSSGQDSSVQFGLTDDLEGGSARGCLLGESG
jgi:hypothetical protein